MVKKKATRSRGRERQVLSSSARANFLSKRQEDDEAPEQPTPSQPAPSQPLPEWAEGMDVILPSSKSAAPTLSAKQQEYLSRKQKARLNTKQKKRLAVLKERKEKRDQRDALYASLAKNQLTGDQMELMKSSSRMGQSDTTKQKLKLALKRTRLGLEVGEDVHLFQSVELPDEKELPAPIVPDQPASTPATASTDNDPTMNDIPIIKKKKKSRKQKGLVQEPVTKKKGFFVPIPEDDNDLPPAKKQKLADISNDGDLSSDEETTQEPIQLLPKSAQSVTTLSTAKAPASASDSQKATSSEDQPMKELKPIVVTKKIISLQRPEDLQEVRTQLPIYMEEQAIMESIHDHPVVIICGETGSGKTTQVPQFLYEAGYGEPDTEHAGLIAVTQPRRVAAVSVAQRVAQEMGVTLGQEVGYQVRYQKKVSHKTRMKFMTDGVLLRELHSDFLLTRYSAIVLDEAHERNINTDILIGLLSRIVPLRQKLAANGTKRDGRLVRPLSLVIMSATLRVDDFVKNKALFDPAPPVIHVEARMFPVTIHFNRSTPLDSYEDEAYRKTIKIHQRLPPGGILIFLTGQQEIEAMCRRLRAAFPLRKVTVEEEEGKSEQSGVQYTGMHVLPLYSLLRTEQQLKVFEPVPEGARFVVVATNVAETSVTIPGIKYVVDTGKVKQKTYEGVSGMSRFEVGWTSQASCDQRAGRAGRVSAGHCYRLFSSAVYNDYFPKFTAPEIVQTPIDGVVLQMKCMGIDKVEEFPFPTPPERHAIRQAVITLQNLEALEQTPSLTVSSANPEEDRIYARVTKVGRTLSLFPVSPRFAKMLSLGKQGGAMPYIIAIVAALSVQSYPLLRPFTEEEEDAEGEEEQEDQLRSVPSKKKSSAVQAHERWQHPLSDLLTVLRAIGAYEHAVFVEGQSSKQFCMENFLHERSMKEIHMLRLQLTEIIESLTDSKSEEGDTEMEADEHEQATQRVLGNKKLQQSHLAPPTNKQELIIRQIITSGLNDRIATLARNQPLVLEEGGQRPSKYQYLCCTTNLPVYIHPTSILFQQKPLPEYVVFTELHQTERRTYIKGVTAISPSWLPNLSKNLCEVTKVLAAPEPSYDSAHDAVMCTARPSYSGGWSLPPQVTTYPESLDAYKWFARLLLAGDIFSSFRPFVDHLTAQPTLITSSWNIRKVNSLVESLAEKKIRSKAALVRKWKKQPKFLLNAMELWVASTHHDQLRKAWPLTN